MVTMESERIRISLDGADANLNASSEFSPTLYELRSEAGLSQTKLAKKADTNHSYVSRLESGARSPAREKVESIVAALELDQIQADRLRASAGFRGDGNTISHEESGMLALNALLKSPDVSKEDKEWARAVISAIVGSMAAKYALSSGAEE